MLEINRKNRHDNLFITLNHHNRIVLILLVVAYFAIPASAKDKSAESALHYTLNFDQAKNHYVQVELKIPDTSTKSCELMMATWTPGSYLIREHSRHVDRMQAEDIKGNSLTVNKTSKNRWVVETKGSRTVTVKYRLYCHNLSVRTNFVDNEFAVINGAASFMTLTDNFKRPHLLSVNLPEHWKQSVCALDLREGKGPNEYAARNFQQLVDSPVVAGNPDMQPFSAGGRRHWLVNLGGNGLWDGRKAASDVSRLVKVQQKMWEVIPYNRYFFLNVIAESGGGLEHNESTLVMTSRWSYRDKHAYRKWLGLISHEFFHTWNVRTLRPGLFINYNYESEQYCTSLWIVEGITSYYDDLCLLRAGLIDRTTYLDLLSGQIQRLKQTPGRFNQSLTESSFDTWIKFYRSNENSHNTQISYYNKGAVVSFLLDTHIRRLTGNKKTLDHVMRLMYKRFSGPRGYEEHDFRNAVSQITGTDMNPWFKDAIDSAGDLNYKPALSWFGLKFQSDKTGSKPWTGLKTEKQSGKLKVYEVVDNSPGFRAGINTGDEIIAVNNFRVSSDNWDKILKQFKTGTDLLFLVARRGKLLQLTLTLSTAPSENWTIIKVKNPDNRQKQNLNNWLDQESGI